MQLYASTMKHIAIILEGLNEIHAKITAEGDEEFCLPGRIPIYWFGGGGTGDLLGHAVDEIGGSYSFVDWYNTHPPEKPSDGGVQLTPAAKAAGF